MNYLTAMRLKILTFISAILIGIAAFRFSMLLLTILTGHGFINSYSLPYETQEIILDIRCGKDDSFCRGEKCRH